MTRDEAVQRPPDRGAALSDFPARDVREGTVWRRAHRHEYGPWFFACAGTGRFDLSEPAGTCYVATTAETAAREIIGPDFIATRVVPDTLLAGRVVSDILLPHAVTAARLTSTAAFGYGVSNELCSMNDYSVPQRWATAFHEADFDGVWYRPRFSPGSGRALALFGPAGPREGSSHGQTPLATVVAGMLDVTVASTNERNEYEILDEPQ